MDHYQKRLLKETDWFLLYLFILYVHMLHLENYRLDTEYENQLIIKVTLVCTRLKITVVNKILV